MPETVNHYGNHSEVMIENDEEFEMPTTLTLKIPDRIYRPLLEKADQQGKTFDEIILDWLEDMSKDDPVQSDDPLLRLAGAFSSDVADVGSHHDFYIGRELKKRHE
ncbi:conserved hypothetical protein [Candidatus Desulfarcum epimagneticum]|uniref:Uncharacterized protein n=1 Tax=uncultured Desulfobacteraceae bacterium TaxID=218296 RepID=A0A484HN38_9BACT|nr:conserved hypothetical protein [uncultured Desulfobacteraceae bacterium]